MGPRPSRPQVNADQQRSMTPLQVLQRDRLSIYNRRNSSEEIIDHEKNLLEIIPPDRLRRARERIKRKGINAGGADGGGDGGSGSSSSGDKNGDNHSVPSEDGKEVDEFENEAAR